MEYKKLTIESVKQTFSELNDLISYFNEKSFAKYSLIWNKKIECIKYLNLELINKFKL